MPWWCRLRIGFKLCALCFWNYLYPDACGHTFEAHAWVKVYLPVVLSIIVTSTTTWNLRYHGMPWILLCISGYELRIKIRICLAVATLQPYSLSQHGWLAFNVAVPVVNRPPCNTPFLQRNSCGNGTSGNKLFQLTSPTNEGIHRLKTSWSCLNNNSIQIQYIIALILFY